MKHSIVRPSGLIGFMPKNAVTFIINHDSGSTQKLWSFPSGKGMLGYAYILTYPGTPTILYDHFFEWGLKEEIVRLSSVRTRNGICETSVLNINDSRSRSVLSNVRWKSAYEVRMALKALCWVQLTETFTWFCYYIASSKTSVDGCLFCD